MNPNETHKIDWDKVNTMEDMREVLKKTILVALDPLIQSNDPVKHLLVPLDYRDKAFISNIEGRLRREVKEIVRSMDVRQTDSKTTDLVDNPSINS